MSKFAEKLIILGDVALGLLSRFHNLLEFKRPDLFTPDLDKYSKALVKKFPEFPDKEKVIGSDVFAKRATDISTALKDYYLTFLDLLHFNDEAWKLLQEVATSVTDFRPNLNADLLGYFMTLFTRYVQLHILVFLAQDKQLHLASYAKCFHITSGNTEPSFLKIAAYLKTFSDPVKTLQSQCVSISDRIGATLSYLHPAIMKWSNGATSLMEHKVFNLIDEPAKLTMPIGEQSHLELQNMDKYRVWMMVGLLVCPSNFVKDGTSEMLKLVLKDTFVMPVFRDKSISIHEEFAKLVDNYKLDKFKLSKHKKVFKEAYSDPTSSALLHHELRTYLRHELHTALRLFGEFPACIPPKIQMLFALLQLARNEVVWYFRHQGVVPYKNKKYNPVVDPNISYLIHYAFAVSELIANHKKGVQQYYWDLLMGADVSHVNSLLTAFSAAAGASGASQLMSSIMAALPKLAIDDNFESIRLNWYRCSSALAESKHGVQLMAVSPLSAAMTQLISHTRNVDCIANQLKNHASFMDLYFYRTALAELLREVVKSPYGQAAHALSLVKVLSHALHNVHRIAPEEQAQIGKEAVTSGDGFLRSIVLAVEAAVKQLADKIKVLRSQTKPSRVAQRLQAAQQSDNSSSSSKDQPHKQPLPGSESLFQNRAGVYSVSQFRKTISDLCSAIHQNDTIVVYNIEFVPREYLIESMSHHIRASVRSLAVVGKNIARPTVLLNSLRDAMYAYQQVERNVNIDLSSIFRDVLLSEFTDESCGGAGDALVSGELDGKEEKKDAGATTVIHAIAAWYQGLFARDLGVEHGISFSPVKQAFVSRPISMAKGQPPAIHLDAEWFTDVNELRALVTLCGPYGVRVIDKALLSVVVRSVTVIRDCLIKNQPMLTMLSGRFTEHTLWQESINKLQHVEVLLTHTTVVGCVLHFRKLLRKALASVVNEKMPFLYQNVKLAFKHLHDVSEVSLAFAPLDYLSQDVGLDVGEADHSLRLALAKFKTQLSDLVLWNLLPELYGVSYVGARWKSAVYQISEQGYTNNAHCMAECIRALIFTFQRIALKSDNSAKIDFNVRIQHDFENFVRCSAYSLLHMATRHVGEPYPVATIMGFLEQFILGSGGRLTLALLEDCFPFTLLRENYIKLYQKAAQIDYEDEKEEKKQADPAASSSSSSSSSSAPSAAAPAPSPQAASAQTQAPQAPATPSHVEIS